MVGSAINRALLKKGYGKKSNGGAIFSPSRKELDFSNFEKLLEWFYEFKPTYSGYDFIIPKKDIKKTLKKMDFFLKK